MLPWQKIYGNRFQENRGADYYAIGGGFRGVPTPAYITIAGGLGDLHRPDLFKFNPTP